MSGGIEIPDKETAIALNTLARHQAIRRLYQDILFDLQVCEIEGLDKTEYISERKKALDFAISAAEKGET